VHPLRVLLCGGRWLLRVPEHCRGGSHTRVPGLVAGLVSPPLSATAGGGRSGACRGAGWKVCVSGSRWSVPGICVPPAAVQDLSLLAGGDAQRDRLAEGGAALRGDKSRIQGSTWKNTENAAGLPGTC